MTEPTPDPILIGHVAATAHPKIAVVSDSPVLLPHVGKPWFNYYMAKRFEIHLEAAPTALKHGTPFTVDASKMWYHSVICGMAGSGKTRLAMHLLFEQLKRGNSVVLMDIQDKTIFMALDAARKAGLTTDQITLVWSREVRGVPGWNPFDQPLEKIRQAVGQFVALIQPEGGWAGAFRMVDLLKSSAVVVASQGLTIIELIEFLQNDDYRDGLLAQFYASPAAERFRSERKFFQVEFPKWNQSKKDEAMGPVINKIRDLGRTEFFEALLGARRETLDLPSLWQKQRLILVLIDVDVLGADEAKVLSGIITRSLLSTARWVLGPRHVYLFVDEMGAQSKFGSKAIQEIIATSRQRQLHLMAAMQWLDQLPDDLREALLSLNGVRAFLTLSDKDAPLVAKKLVTGTGGSINKIAVNTDGDLMERNWYWIVGPDGKRVTPTDTAWQKIEQAPDKLACLQEMEKRSMKLFVQLTDEVMPLATFMSGCHPSIFTFSRKKPEDKKSANLALAITVTYPRFKKEIVSGKRQTERIDEMQMTLQRLPKRHAYVWADGIAQIRVIDSDFSDEAVDLEPYFKNGQSAQEIKDTINAREADIESLSIERVPAPSVKPSPAPPRRKTVPAKPEVLEDGSF